MKAAPSLPGLQRPDGPTCFVNREAFMKRKAALGKFSPGFAPPISATTAQVLVIRVDFSDKSLSTNLNTANLLFNNVNKYYLENSYGTYSASFTVSVCAAPAACGANGAYRVNSTMGAYGTDDPVFGIGGRDDALVTDAVTQATENYDFTQYSHYMIYHAGNGQETTGISADIWSVYITAGNFNKSKFTTTDGKDIVNLTMVPETEANGVSPLGVICHEYGHQLGLPDLYNTAVSGGQSKVGYWSLMDYGVYLGLPQGSEPSHLDPWSKQFLGFSSPQTLTHTGEADKTLLPAETTRDAFFRLPVGVSGVSGGGSNEYFLMEYRKKTAAEYDSDIPASGVLIWHVDDSIAANASRLSANNINAGVPNLGVDLVEADNTDSSTNNGDSTDAWPGALTSFKSPKSSAFNGNSSGIEVSNLSGVGSSIMSMTIKMPYTLFAPPGKVLVQGGPKGYVNPNLNEKASIYFKPTENGSISVDIYTLSGSLVWSTTVTGTANQQSVIQWDGKSSALDVLASGIYVVRISGGGIDTQKKIAIVK